MELLLILLLALVVFGPEQLPVIARALGRWTGRARSLLKGIEQQVQHELAAEELRKAVAMARQPVTPEPDRRG